MIWEQVTAPSHFEDTDHMADENDTNSTEGVRAMKRIGTVGNYLRVTKANEHLLRDRRMTEVTLVKNEDGKMVEEDVTHGDSLASRDLGRLVGDVKSARDRLDSLVAYVATQVGGPEALERLGVEVPEQTIHANPGKKESKRRQKLSDRKRDAQKRATDRRSELRAEAKSKDDEAKGKAPAAPAPADLVDGSERVGDDPGKPDTDAPAPGPNDSVAPADLVDGSERTPAEEDPGAAEPTDPGGEDEQLEKRAAGDETVTVPVADAAKVDGSERLGDDPGNPESGDKSEGEAEEVKPAATVNEDI